MIHSIWGNSKNKLKWMELGDIVATARDSKAPMKTSLSISVKQTIVQEKILQTTGKEKPKTRCSFCLLTDKIIHLLISD